MSDLWEVQKPGIVNRTETLEREVAFYAVCSTAGSVAEKTATVDDYFRLEVGSKVCIRFAQTNTASAAPTLNVNGTGAYQIRYRDAVGYSGYLKEYVASDRTYEFVFDGEAWQLIGDLDTILAISDSVTTNDSDTAASSAAVKKLNDLISSLETRVAKLEESSWDTLTWCNIWALDQNGNYADTNYSKSYSVSYTISTRYDSGRQEYITDYDVILPSGGTWGYVFDSTLSHTSSGTIGGQNNSDLAVTANIRGVASGGTKIATLSCPKDQSEQVQEDTIIETYVINIRFNACWRVAS